MAEIELGILGRQCLDRCIDNAETLTHEAAALRRCFEITWAKVDNRILACDTAARRANYTRLSLGSRGHRFR